MEANLQTWTKPSVELRASKIFNLHRYPYERADETSNTSGRITCRMWTRCANGWRPRTQ